METILVLLAAAALSSCQLTVGTDGTRTWSISGEDVARAIIIHSGK